MNKSGHMTVSKVHIATFTRFVANKHGRLLTLGRIFSTQTLKSSLKHKIIRPKQLLKTLKSYLKLHTMMIILSLKTKILSFLKHVMEKH